MANSLDQSGDLNLSELHRYNQLYGFPEFVKQADRQAVSEPPSRKATLYADPRNLQFPVHSKAATYVSQIFFLEHEDQVHPKLRAPIQERLDKLAAYWGIVDDLRAVKEKHASFRQDNVPDSAFAIVWTNDDGHKERRYPLRNTMEVRAAAEWFYQRQPELRQEFRFADRQKIASKILSKADEFGAAIPEEASSALQKAAGLGCNSPKRIAEGIRFRTKAADRMPQEVGTMLNSLAEKVANKPKAFLDPATVSQLAEVVETFDREYHLLNKYSHALPSVEDLLFDVTYEKLASFHKQACQTITGSVYTQEQFAKLSVADVRDLFGDELTESVMTGLAIDPEKFAEVAATLPRPDAAALDDLMADRGLDPLQKDANAIGFTVNELKQMAVI